MNFKSISIGIPTYKRAKYVTQLLNSIKNNIYDKHIKINIIIVDNTISDEIKNVATDFNKELNIHYIKNKKGVVGQNRNIAAQNSKDDIIIFADSDIQFSQNVIQKVINYFKQHINIGLLSPKIYFKKGLKVGKIDRPRKEDRRIKIKNTIYLETNFGRALIVNRKKFLKICGYDYLTFPDRGEGVDLSCRFWRAGFPLAYESSIIVYHHHDAPSSLTRTTKGKIKMIFSLKKMEYKYKIKKSSDLYFYKVIQNGVDFQSLTKNVYRDASKQFNNWKKNIDIEKVRRKLDRDTVYDFTPQDIFTRKKLLLRCINNSYKK